MLARKAFGTFASQSFKHIDGADENISLPSYGRRIYIWYTDRGIEMMLYVYGKHLTVSPVVPLRKKIKTASLPPS